MSFTCKIRSHGGIVGWLCNFDRWGSLALTPGVVLCACQPAVCWVDCSLTSTSEECIKVLAFCQSDRWEMLSVLICIFLTYEILPACFRVILCVCGNCDRPVFFWGVGLFHFVFWELFIGSENQTFVIKGHKSYPKLSLLFWQKVFLAGVFGGRTRGGLFFS